MQLLPSIVAATALLAAIPAQHVLSQSAGPQPTAGFGNVLGSIADLDGDGARDLVVGVPGYTPNGIFTGHGAVEVRASGNGAVLRRSIASLPGTQLGLSVAGLGDVDGDGVVDYAAGSPTYNGNDGTVVVYSGFDGSALYQWFGQPYSEFGTAIVAVDDFNHDGRADLGISAPHNSSTRPYGLVRYYALFGTGRTLQVTGTNGSEFGASMAVIGDVNGDGRADLAIGEPGTSYQGASSGSVWLVDSSLGGGLGTFWEQRSVFSMQDRGGSRVAAAGDVDGDGCPDVMCSGHGVYVLSGRTGGVIHHLVSNDAGFGAAFAGIGDYDGDGRDDFAIGAPAYNVLAGRVYVYSGRSGAVIQTLDGGAGERFGTAIVALGDVDGDRRGDFAVGAPGYRVLGVEFGRVTVHGFDTVASIAEYGTACGAPDAYFAGRPVVGGSCTVRCGNLQHNSVGAWLFGVSDAQFGAVALPLSLQPFGFTGCSLLVSIDATAWFFTGNLPQTTWSFTNIPPHLVGASLYMQAAVLDAAAPGGMSFSDGVALQFGNR